MPSRSTLRSTPRAGSLLTAALPLVIVTGAMVARPARSAGTTPDTILFDGKVFTGDPALPAAQALAIRGDRIVAVGDDATVKALADSHTKIVDLGGRTVIPGLNDAHTHLGIWPKNEVGIETEGYDPSWADIVAATRAAAAKAEPGAILSGTIGPLVTYDTKIDRAALDAIEPNHPVVLNTFDGHAYLLNSAALRKLGINESIRDPVGGKYERANGKLNGWAREYAAGDVTRRLAALTSDADAMAALKGQLNRAARYGITSMQDLPGDMSPERFAKLAAGIPTPIRLRITRMNMTTPTGPDFAEGRNAPRRPSPLIAINGTKWLMDGVIFEGSMTPRAQGIAGVKIAGSPYSYSGLPMLFGRRDIDAIVRDALTRNDQLEVHVFGRPAALAMLDALERAGGARVWATRRVRFEHGDGLTPDLFERAKRLGIIVSQQGTHLMIGGIATSLGDDYIARLRAEKAQSLRSLLAAGIPVALGSDGPINPYLSLLGAVTNPDRPDETITMEQAVRCYTYGSAYAEFQENEKGTIAIGMMADIAVLSQDIFSAKPDALPGTTSVLTLVGGRVVYDSHQLGPSTSSIGS